MKPAYEHDMSLEKKWNGQAHRSAARLSNAESRQMLRASSPSRPSARKNNGGDSSRRAKLGGSDDGITNHSHHLSEENELTTKRTWPGMRVSSSDSHGDEYPINHRPELEHHSRQCRTNAWIFSQGPWIPGFQNGTGQGHNEMEHDGWGWVCKQLQDICEGESNSMEASTGSSKLTCQERKTSSAKQNGKMLEELDAIGTWANDSGYTNGACS